MKRTLRLRPALLAALTLSFALLVAGSVSVGAAGGASAKKKPHGAPSGTPVIYFAADGMRPDLVDKYAKAGAMPTMRQLMAQGVKGENGLLQGFPPNTGVGWYTLSTGTWPGEHGSTNNTFHRTGEGNFNNSTSFATTGILQADHIAQSAERSGKTVVSMEWVGTRKLVPAAPGPGRRLPHLHRRPRDHAQLRPARPAGRRQRVRRPVPEGDARRRGRLDERARPPSARRSRRRSRTTTRRSPANGVWDVYIYDSTNDGTTNYDRVLIVSAANAKNGATAVANLTQGEWADAKLTLATGTVRGPDGRLLRQGDRPQRGPLEVPPLLHLGAARERDVQRARRGRVDRLRGEAEPRLPDLHRGRLRPARGRHRRRGHLRRAGPDVEGRPLGVPAVHPRPGPVRPRDQARPAARGLADHRRVPAPVHRARDADRHRRQPEPVLRRPHKRRRPGRSRRDPRGLHPLRLPGGRPDARPRPRPGER